MYWFYIHHHTCMYMCGHMCTSCVVCNVYMYVKCMYSTRVHDMCTRSYMGTQSSIIFIHVLYIIIILSHTCMYFIYYMYWVVAWTTVCVGMFMYVLVPVCESRWRVCNKAAVLELEAKFLSILIFWFINHSSSSWVELYYTLHIVHVVQMYLMKV